MKGKIFSTLFNSKIIWFSKSKSILYPQFIITVLYYGEFFLHFEFDIVFT